MHGFDFVDFGNIAEQSGIAHLNGPNSFPEAVPERPQRMAH
jgi:hypothetical protein